MEEMCSKVKIERPLYDQKELREEYEYERVKNNCIERLCSSSTSCEPMDVLKNTVPVLNWLPKYKWKEDFTSDLISGITVAIMHISQGMAYGMLGNVPPVIGIYMAFFPVLVYFFLGNSRHNSMGTFAVVCLMVGKVVLEHSNFQGADSPYSPIEVATTVTFICAIYQLIMYAFRLGIVATLLSETLVSGFTTGAAVHVFVSQIKDIFGLSLPKEKGNFVNILTCRNVFTNLSNTNTTTLIISAITILVTFINNELLKPRIAKRCKFPIPIELMAIIIGTVVSLTLDLHNIYGVKIIGVVPSGLPGPQLPQLDLISDIWLDCFMIAVVSYTVSLSMGLIFAQKFNYEVDANQELLAQGMGNMVGSFFSCMPFTASLSRTSIQVSVGGKTQLVSLVSCGILAIILIWIGPYFEQLPRCILAGVIVVSLKGMLMQVKDFFVFWSLSKLDAMVWLVTFIVVTFVAIDIGLLVGIVMSLVTIFVLGLKPYTCLLGWVPHTDLYLDINRYKGVKELENIKIFHYQGSINFASKNFFKSELYEAINIFPQKELELRRKMEKLASVEETLTDTSSISSLKQKLQKLSRKSCSDVRCIVLDFSALSYIDPSGVTMLKLLSQEFQRIDIRIYIGGCSEPVYDTMSKCDLLNEKKDYYELFPTVHDAVQRASASTASNTTLSTICSRL